MKSRHFLLLGLAVIIGLTVVFGTLVYAKPYAFHGSLYDPPLPAADFALEDQNGEIFRLSDQGDRLVLIFFGYSHCPDVCPVTLSDFRNIKAQLGDQAERARFVFITVDPERDTPDHLRQYLSNFDPGIIGLTGDRSTLEPVWKAYGVYQSKVETDSPSDYLVDHTARVYVIDGNGNFRLTFPFGTSSEEMAADVEYLLKEN